MEFQKVFPTDRACFEYLCIIKWPEGFICPYCQNHEAWKLKRYILRCKNCKKDISPTAGTIFQDRRIPLTIIFQAMWYVTCQKQGVSALSLQQILGVGSYETTWTWLMKLRVAMVNPKRELLSGTVEVDETLIGGVHTGKRGRRAIGKELVLVAVEDGGKKGIGRIRLKHIPNAKTQTLQKAISELIAPNSTIRTDGWSGYTKLEEKGYTHIVTNHREEEPGIDPTPMVHLISSLLKRWLLGTHQGAANFSHINYYLDEFTFRFNRRNSKSRGQLFLRLMQQALLISPAPVSTFNTSPSL